MSGIRACGSKPPLRPSRYLMSLDTSPSRAPMLPQPPRVLCREPSENSSVTWKISPPSSVKIIREAFSRNFGSIYACQVSGGSRTCASASTTSYRWLIVDLRSNALAFSKNRATAKGGGAAQCLPRADGGLDKGQKCAGLLAREG